MPLLFWEIAPQQQQRISLVATLTIISAAVSFAVYALKIKSPHATEVVFLSIGISVFLLITLIFTFLNAERYTVEIYDDRIKKISGRIIEEVFWKDILAWGFNLGNNVAFNAIVIKTNKIVNDSFGQKSYGTFLINLRDDIEEKTLVLFKEKLGEENKSLTDPDRNLNQDWQPKHL